MKKILNQSSEEDVTEKNALTRKLYRYISEAVKKVDEGTSKSKTIAELFTPSLEVYRQKLRENCEKLIFADPLLYGRKAQELLWRKGYYETVATSKRLRASCSKDQEHLVLAHIDTGIGHYHNLISKIQHEVGIFYIDLHIDYPQSEISNNSNKYLNNDDVKEFMKAFIQSCLIYLGDLSRYKSDYDEAWAFAMSYRYYMQAANVDTNAGMPYNQLGTLHTGRNHHLDSVSYYIKCLLCNTPFEGAEGNLIRIFDKNNKQLENNTVLNSDIIDQQESVKIMICKFLSLVEHWYFDKSIANFNDLCASTLYEIKECLRFQPLMIKEETKSDEYLKYIQQNEISPDHVTSSIVNKMITTLLLLINKLERENSDLVMPLKTFTLTILSQLLHKVHNDFTAIGFDKDVFSKIVDGFKEKARNQRNANTKLGNGFHNSKETIETNNDVSVIIKDREPTETTELVTPENSEKSDAEIQDKEKLLNGDTNNKVEPQNKSKAKKSSILQKLRRRKRQGGPNDSSESSDDDDVIENSSHSDNEASDDEYDNELSTDESDNDDIDSSYSTTSEDEKSENNCKDDSNAIDKDESSKEKIESNENSTPQENNMKEEILSSKENLIENEEKTISFNERMFQEFLENNNVLVSLHLILNWLFGESELIVSCGTNGKPMFLALVNILNTIHCQMFPKLSWNNYCLSNQFHPSLGPFHELFFSLKYNGFRKIPVAEDYDVKDLEICSKGLKYIDWERHKKTNLSNLEANTIRLMKIVDFGVFIVKLNIGIVFNKRLKLYLLKKTQMAKKPNYKKYGKSPRDIHTKSQRSYKPRNIESDKGGSKQSGGSLMKSLGRLWLSEQVRALESEVGSKKQANLPAYVILDADALSQHTHLVKQLVASKKIIVLIPTIVLHTMDELKKDSGAARSAIRWLESQLSNGCRFIRTQRPNENTPLHCVKYPKKIQRHVQNFIQIIEFCHFFLSNEIGETSASKANMNGSGDSNGNDQNDKSESKTRKTSENQSNTSNLVIFLTGSGNLYTEQKDFSYKGVAYSAGVTMETIQDFCYKWRHHLGKGTKKR